MDLKSILSDSQQAGQRAHHPPGPPRISTGSHTPHSSYDGRIDNTPSSDVSSARPTPYEVHGRGGSYFNSHSQSPYPNASASSTPSVGHHSAWGQSPGGQGNMSIPPPPHAHSQSSFVSPQPPTPNSAQSAHQHSLTYYQQQYQQYQQLQSPPFQPGNLPHALSRQISPSQYQGPPATPLGPPIGYPKPSPHRPSSQGGPDHLRRASVSSINSIISNHNYPEPAGRESISRSHPSQDFGRERSISVSPKTIPRPAPQREMSTGSNPTRPSLPPQSHSQMNHHPSFEQRQVESIPAQATPCHSVSSIPDQREPSTRQSSEQAVQSSPAIERPVKNEHTNSVRQPSAETVMNSSPAVERPVKREATHQSLKRSASHLSDAPAKIVKRPRNERPAWAESARRGRRLNLHFNPPASVETKGPAIPQRNTPRPQQANGATHQARPDQTVGRIPFAHSISDAEVLPDITYRVTDWVMRTIGDVPPPPNAMFELEAKIGHIQNGGRRIFYPMLDSEVLLNTHNEDGLRFKSAMTEQQHMHMNQRLNEWTQASIGAYARDNRTNRISYAHPRDNDEFFQLTDEGRGELHPELLAFIESSSNLARTNRDGQKEIRVRRTKNEDGTQYLIKVRVANREVHCPQYDFDYRLSISLEAGYYGPERYLVSMNDTKGRQKDRLSYTHNAFHIDLTQVRHESPNEKEHELEVEMMPEILEEEMGKYRKRAGDFKLDQYINDMLINTRLLVREGGPRRQ